MAGEISISEELSHFIKDNTSDYYTAQVILFFAGHPYTRFNELAIIHALKRDGGGRLIQEALKDLVSKGIIKTWMDSKVTLFSLIDNMRTLAAELARLNIRQQQRLLPSNCTGKQKHPFQRLAMSVRGEMPDPASMSNQDAPILDAEVHQLEEYASSAA